MSRTIFEPFSASWLSFFGCAAVLVGAYRALNSCKRRRRHPKKGFSEHQLSWTSKVIYKTAWFVAHRIRQVDHDTEPFGGKDMRARQLKERTHPIRQ